MATVINDKVFLDLFASLGFTNGNDLLQRVGNAGIPASVIYTYLQALQASPSGLNDQTISGVTPTQGTQITTFLKNQGLVVT